MAVLPQVMPRRLLVNSAAIAGGEAASRLATFLMAVVIAHHFGATALGQYGFALAAASILLLVPDFGLHLYLVRELSANRRVLGSVFWNVHWLKVILLTVMLALGGIFFRWGTSDAGQRVLFGILAGRVILQTFSQASMAVFKACEEMHYVAWQQVLNTALVAAWVVGALALGAGLPMVVLGFVAGQAAETCLGWRIVHTRFSPGPPAPWNTRAIAAIVAASFPIGVTAILQATNLRVDILVLSRFATGRVLGQFQAAAWFPVGSFLAASLLMTVLFPKISRLLRAKSRQGGEYLHGLIKNSVLVAGLAAILTWFAAPQLLVWVFGRETALASGALRILAPMLPLVFLNTILFYVFVAAGCRSVYFGTLAFGVGAGGALSFFLTALGGPAGCAFADVAREGLISAACIFFLVREERTRATGAALAKAFSAATVLTVLGYVLTGPIAWNERWPACWLLLLLLGTIAGMGLPNRREWALLTNDNL